MTWRSRSELWDLLDPLVIVTTPVASILVLVVVVRMFEIHLLWWS
jgi:hypothetical protein